MWALRLCLSHMLNNVSRTPQLANVEGCFFSFCLVMESAANQSSPHITVQSAYCAASRRIWKTSHSLKLFPAIKDLMKWTWPRPQSVHHHHHHLRHWIISSNKFIIEKTQNVLMYEDTVRECSSGAEWILTLSHKSSIMFSRLHAPAASPHSLHRSWFVFNKYLSLYELPFNRSEEPAGPEHEPLIRFNYSSTRHSCHTLKEAKDKKQQKRK